MKANKLYDVIREELLKKGIDLTSAEIEDTYTHYWLVIKRIMNALNEFGDKNDFRTVHVTGLFHLRKHKSKELRNKILYEWRKKHLQKEQ